MDVIRLLSWPAVQTASMCKESVQGKCNLVVTTPSSYVAAACRKPWRRVKFVSKLLTPALLRVVSRPRVLGSLLSGVFPLHQYLIDMSTPAQ
jgi:hypothetical protein